LLDPGLVPSGNDTAFVLGRFWYDYLAESLERIDHLRDILLVFYWFLSVTLINSAETAVSVAIHKLGEK
jgi:hypothetical protein